MLLVSNIAVELTKGAINGRDREIRGSYLFVISCVSLDVVPSRDSQRQQQELQYSQASLSLVKSLYRQWAGGGVDMRAGTRHATTQDRGIPDSDVSMG